MNDPGAVPIPDPEPDAAMARMLTNLLDHDALVDLVVAYREELAAAEGRVSELTRERDEMRTRVRAVVESWKSDKRYEERQSWQGMARSIERALVGPVEPQEPTT